MKCGICGAILVRQPAEKSYLFRKRKYCSALCRHRANSAMRVAAWRDPAARARMQRGIDMRKASDEYADWCHLQRQIMVDRWQNPDFVSMQRSRQGARLLTEQQVKAIRADPRPIQTIARAYCLSYTTVRKLRNRLIYRDVE